MEVTRNHTNIQYTIPLTKTQAALAKLASDNDWRVEETRASNGELIAQIFTRNDKRVHAVYLWTGNGRFHYGRRSYAGGVTNTVATVKDWLLVPWSPRQF